MILQKPAVSVSLLVLLFLALTSLVDVSPAYAGSSTVVISEFRVRGPNGGNDEFIELFNLSSSPVTIGGWTVRGSNSSGTISIRATIAANTVLNPGCHFLLTNASTSSGPYSGTVTGDQTYSTGVTDDGGIALADVNSTVVDSVGMSAGSAYKEGTPVANLGSNNLNRSYERRPGETLGSGTDTDSNSADFQLITPSDPQNLSSACIGQPQAISATGASNPGTVDIGGSTLLTVAVTAATTTGVTVTADLTSLGGSANTSFYDDGTNGDAVAGDLVFSLNYTVPASAGTGTKNISAIARDGAGNTASANITVTINPLQLTIPQIQGPGARSPHEGQSVRTTGVVTGLKGNGFFIQDVLGDGDPSTSDGLFVFTSSRPAVQKGDSVSVSGNVQEFASATDPAAAPLTEISGGPTVTINSSGNPLPSPIALSASDIDPDGAADQLEKYEAMLVHVDTLNVVGPTGGSLSEANATSTSNGVFFGTFPGLPRPFRGAGIEQPAPVPNPPCCIPSWNGEPQRIRVDSRSQPTSTPVNVATGAIVANLTGPLDFGQHAYTIVTETAPEIVSGNIGAIPVPAPDAAAEFTVASFNMERFYDTVNDAGVSDVALTSTAFANRLNKASLAIRNVLYSPDVIGIAEMENLSTLQALADKVNADTVAAGGSDPQYTPYLAEGNDIGGIDVAFLVKGSRIEVQSVQQYNKDATYTDPTNGQQALLNDRPPLVLQGSVTNEHETTNFVVIVNHLRSLIGVDGSDGERVRAKRRAQAEDLANLIQSFQAADPGAKIASLGDYNAFDVSDGYVDLMGTIKGTPAPADQVLLASPDLVDPDLTDLLTTLAADQQYSYVNFGSAQTLDHILVSQGMLGILSRFAIARNNADFPEIYRNDPARPERLSDHDIPVAYFNLPLDQTPPILTLPADFTVEAASPAGALVTYTATALDANDGATSVLCNPASGSTFPLGANTVSCTTQDARQNTATGEFHVNVVDTTPPVVTVTGVTDGASYALGAVPATGCKTTDTVSAIAVNASLAVTGGTPNGAGTFTATCSGAKDAAGNIASAVSVTYTVSYAWSGFLAPVKEGAAFKTGSAIPLIWSLSDSHGEKAGNLSSIVSLQVAANSMCAGSAEGMLLNPDSPGASALQYDPVLGLFQFTWKTKGLAPGCYDVLLSLDDGITRRTTLALR